MFRTYTDLRRKFDASLLSLAVAKGRGVRLPNLGVDDLPAGVCCEL